MEARLCGGLYNSLAGRSPLKQLQVSHYSTLQNSRQSSMPPEKPSTAGMFMDFMKKLMPGSLAMLVQIKYDQLKSPLLPDILQPFKCGCQNTMQPCEKVIEITKANLDYMKVEYNAGKRNRQQYGYLSVNQHLLPLVPASFPQALTAQLQNILRQTSVSQDAIHMLCGIVEHAKVEHLSYWLFTELNLFRMQQEPLLGTIYQIAEMVSPAVLNVIAKCPAYFEENALLFLRTLGTSLIPVPRYAEYLKRLSINGRAYPAKVLFCLVLSHSDEILRGSSPATYFNWLPAKTCWNHVFTAAEDPRLTL